MDGTNLEGLAEVFKCFICMGKLQLAHLCPHCSKPCCYICIRKWLTEHRSQCPHCRVCLELHDLINCRWIGDVTQQLDTLQQAEDTAKKDLCKDHDEKLSVFCLTCAETICHQCALWGDTHTNHVFKPMEEVYLHHVVKIEEDLMRLRKRHSELKDFISNVEKNIKNLRTAKKERRDEIMWSSAEMIFRLQQQLKNKLSPLLAKQNMWLKECSEIVSILKSAEHQVKSYSKCQLISSSENLMQSIAEYKSKFSVPDYSSAGIDTLSPSEVIPPYECGTFVIQNFSIFQQIGGHIFSPPLKVSGLTWRLKVYPAGNGHERGKYLSVLLELTEGFPETSKYQYRVQMSDKESADSSKSVVHEFASNFNVGECWGFNRFYLLNLLSSEGYLNDDTLVLHFQVRPSSYYQKCKDQTRYISQLETAKDQYIKEVDDLKMLIATSARN